MPSETTRLIGCRSKHRNMCSRALLIARTVFIYAFYFYLKLYACWYEWKCWNNLLEIALCLWIKIINSFIMGGEILDFQLFLLSVLVCMAWRVHLFPFRTQKLSSTASMVLRGFTWESRYMPRLWGEIFCIEDGWLVGWWESMIVKGIFIPFPATNK